MQFQNAGGALQVAFFSFAAIGLDVAELIERFVELAGQATKCECRLGT